MCRLQTPQLEEALKDYPLYSQDGKGSEVELDLSAQGYGKLQVRQQPDFKPTALKNLRDDRLRKFLARFED